MKKKLTQKILNGAELCAPHSSGKQMPVWDTEIPGFGVLISGKTPARTLIAQRQVNGLTRCVTLGSVQEISLEEARARAAETLDSLRRGFDPKRRKDAASSLREVLKDYLAARIVDYTGLALQHTDAHAIKVWITNWCSAHPLDNDQK